MEFDVQCGRLNTKLEYEQEQLEKQRKKLHNLEETIDQQERTMAEWRKVIRGSFADYFLCVRYFCLYLGTMETCSA